jgi:hypothetical protein
LAFGAVAGGWCAQRHRDDLHPREHHKYFHWFLSFYFRTEEAYSIWTSSVAVLAHRSHVMLGPQYSR